MSATVEALYGNKERRLLLPPSAEGLVEVDHRDALVAYGIAQAELGVEVGTLGVEQVDVADGTVDVLQLGQFDRRCPLSC